MFNLDKILTLVLAVACRYAFSQQTGCVETIRSAMDDYNTCVSNAYQMLFSLSYNEAGLYAVQHRCSAINFYSCRERTEYRIGACLDYNQRQSIEFTFHAMDAGYRYWCSDDSRNLYDFYNRRGPTCYYTKQSSFRQCEAEYPLTNPRINEFTTEYCRILDYVLNCMQQVYEQCLPHENPDLTRKYYQAMWSATPCMYPQQLSQTSKGSPKTSLANVWILAAISLLSLVTIHFITK